MFLTITAKSIEQSLFLGFSATSEIQEGDIPVTPKN